MEMIRPAFVESPAHTWFLNHLPEIQSRCRACFARLKGDNREEATAEVTAAVFKAVVHATRNGTLARVTPYYAVVFAARQFRQGRRLAGYNSTDAMSEAALIKGRVKLAPLAARAKLRGAGDLSEELADRRRHADPYEQARQNLDYAEILRCERISTKARKLFRMLSAVRGRGHGKQIAQALNVSEGRVSQLKRQLAEALARHEYGPD